MVFVRRRPTLPQPGGCSTIGAGRLNFRVRDGAGCFPVAMAAVTLVTYFVMCSLCWWLGLGSGRGFLVCVWFAVLCNTRVAHCLFGWVFVVCWVVSPRPISTGRLGIAAVYLRPIYPMVCGGPYPISGWETLS